MEKSVIQRFKEKVEFDSESGCVNWTGYCDPKGYAKFGRGRAAKWLYEFKNGRIPEGLEISHVCHNRACIRLHPEHVIAESHAANMRRSAKRGVWDGTRNPNAKLEAGEVLEIRTLFQREFYSAKTLAEQFNVSLRTIYYVINYETYFDLVPELYGM